MFCLVSGQFPQWFSAPSSTILVLEVPWMAFFYFCWKCEKLCVSYANPSFDKAHFSIWHRCYLTNFFLSNHFFYFSPKSSSFISNLNDDCSQLSFEVYNVCVAQNLRISEFLIEFFFAWTLATSATSRGRNFNLSNLNRVSNFSSRPKLSYETLFVAQKWNWEELDYVFSIRAESAPPRVSRRPKSPGLLGLSKPSLQYISYFELCL